MEGLAKVMVDVEENTSSVGKIMTEIACKQGREQWRGSVREGKDLCTADTWSLLISEPCDRPLGVLWSSVSLSLPPSACVSWRVKYMGIGIVSVSALGLHCVYFSRQTSEDVIKRQSARSKRPRGTSSRGTSCFGVNISFSKRLFHRDQRSQLLMKNLCFYLSAVSTFEAMPPHIIN